jgi:peptidoglycan/LPS O-acetylase OafA/YrhL
MEIRKLNSVRGLAAFIVVVAHYGNSANLFAGALKGSGQLGVMLFFLLSGFLMSYLYMDEPFRRETVLRYIIARFSRVIPLFLVVVIISYFVIKLDLGPSLYPVATVPILLSHLFLLSGVSILWTIPAEIHFYILFLIFWVFWRTQRQHFYVLTALLIISMYFLGPPALGGNLAGLPFRLAIAQALPYFLMGMILGRIYKTSWRRVVKPRNFYLLALIVIVLFFPGPREQIAGVQFSIWMDAGVFLAMTFAFSVVVFLVPDDSPILSSRIGDFTGRVSYSLYLIHVPVLIYTKSLIQHTPFLFFPVFLALTLALSWLSYSVIEAPSRRVIRDALMSHLAVSKSNYRP